MFTLLYQLFWAQACPEGMCTNWTQVPCKVPSLPNPTTHKGLPHHWGLRPLLFLNSDVGSFTSHKNKSVKVLWVLVQLGFESVTSCSTDWEFENLWSPQTSKSISPHNRFSVQKDLKDLNSRNKINGSPAEYCSWLSVQSWQMMILILILYIW